MRHCVSSQSWPLSVFLNFYNNKKLFFSNLKWFFFLPLIKWKTHNDALCVIGASLLLRCCVIVASLLRHRCVIVASSMHPQCVINASLLPVASLLRNWCVINASSMRHCCVINVSRAVEEAFETVKRELEEMEVKYGDIMARADGLKVNGSFTN